MNLCLDCLLRHNEFHKKNLLNIINSITDEKINQFKQKLIEETNNIKLIQKDSNQLISKLKNQIEKLEKFTKDFIDQQKIHILLIVFLKKIQFSYFDIVTSLSYMCNNSFSNFTLFFLFMFYNILYFNIYFK